MTTQSERKSVLDRLLGVAADVRAGEGGPALMLAVNVFLLLAAYYTIRPLRSAFLLPVQIPLPGGTVLRGPEIQSYAGALFAVLFLFIVPLYSSFASRVNRIRLINSVTLFFVVTLVGFFVLGQLKAAPAAVGLTFFLWMGVFNLMIIAQFWSFANDLYTPEAGKRLFAIVGFGGSIGAVGGAFITSRLITRIGDLPMMLVAAAMLLLAMTLTNIINARDRRRPKAVGAPVARREEPLAAGDGLRLVFGQRYLLLIGLLTLTVNIVNTNGNYMLNDMVASMARASAVAGGLTERQIIGAYMATVDFWQNVLSMVIQFFLVSRIFKYLGISGALFLMPLLSLTGYGVFAIAPLLVFIRLTKITENATDYSLQNTLRRALFLPTSREAKYKGLQAVETFFWRAGDMLSAVSTFIVVQWLALSVRGFAVVNVALVALWILLAVQLARENRRLTAQAEAVAA